MLYNCYFTYEKPGYFWKLPKKPQNTITKTKWTAWSIWQMLLVILTWYKQHRVETKYVTKLYFLKQPLSINNLTYRPQSKRGLPT